MSADVTAKEMATIRRATRNSVRRFFKHGPLMGSDFYDECDAEAALAVCETAVEIGSDEFWKTVNRAVARVYKRFRSAAQAKQIEAEEDRNSILYWGLAERLKCHDRQGDQVDAIRALERSVGVDDAMLRLLVDGMSPFEMAAELRITLRETLDRRRKLSEAANGTKTEC